MTAPLRVMLVTGAYHPQISSSASQCRAVARVLDGRVSFSVLTTATDLSLAPCETIDHVTVHRVLVHPDRPGALGGVPQLLAQYRRAVRGASLIHVHGVSRKNVVISGLAAATRLPIILTLHTSGQDEPDAIRRQGRAAWWGFRRADKVVSVSPRLADRYLEAGLPPDRLIQIPNGIDLQRFAPADVHERQRTKRALGLPPHPMVLFVGFFSRDKRPDFLLDAWLGTAAAGLSTLVFVGATGRSYREIDPTLVEAVRARARAAGVEDRVLFVEPTHQIERYYQAAETYVLSSRREAMPMALLEAMSSGLPVIATRLAGVTERIITDGADGLLFGEDDVEGLMAALRLVLGDADRAAALGAEARRTVGRRFSLESVAEQWLQLYRQVAA